MNILQKVVLELRDEKDKSEWEIYKKRNCKYSQIGFIGNFAYSCMSDPGVGRYNLTYCQSSEIVDFLNRFIEGDFIDDESGVDYYETEFKFLGCSIK